MPKRKKTKGMKIVTLNNKSRKGQYIYLREGGRSRYYKLVEGVEPKGIVKHYMKELKKTRKRGSQAGRKLLRKKVPKTKMLTKKVSIESAIKKGKPEMLIKDSRIGTSQLNKLKLEMFKSLVKRKKYLKDIVKDNNLEKIKHRFEVIATIYGESEILATINKIGTTPDQALKQIKDNLKVGEYLDSSPGLMQMNELGWNGVLNQRGTITRVGVRVVFRKEA